MKILKLSKTNLYLLNIHNGYLLIDTGYASDKAQFLNLLKRNNISIKEIKYIYLTHHHDDHVGLVNDIILENKDIIVTMNEHCSELIKQGFNARTYGGGWCSKGMKVVAETYRKFNNNWTLSFPPYTPRKCDIILNSHDTDLKDLLGIDLKSIYTPGHTIDSISLLDNKGNIFCGDAASNYLQWAGTKYAPAFVTDFNEFYSSWNKLLLLEINMVYPSHGIPFHQSKFKKHLYQLSNEKMGTFVWD